MSQTRKVRRESNCEDHQEGSRHTILHKSEMTFQEHPNPTPPMESSFKAAFPGVDMETPQITEPVPGSSELSVQEQPPQPMEKGAVGIVNIGNTCYMNSTLQAIRSSFELTAFFLQNRHEEYMAHKDPKKKPVILTKAYIEILRMLWNGTRSQSIRPVGFFNDMCHVVKDSIYEQFQMKIAHDSHEFLMLMLESFHEALSEEVNMVIHRPPPQTPADHVIQKALEFWKQQFQKSYSPFVDLIFGLFMREMDCHECKNKSYSWEVFNCLKLSMPHDATREHPATLEACLAEEFKDEEIEEYACDHCAPKRGRATRRTYLWKLPRILFVVLKRFSPTGQKIQTPFAHDLSTPVSFSKCFNEYSPELSKTRKYSLFSTVDHHGVSQGGHYTNQSLNTLDQKWYVYDDDSVYPIEKPSFGPSSYILAFYPNN